MVRKKKNQGAVWISTGLTHKGFIESATHGTVQKLASLPIFELRVFRSKNSVVLLYTAIRGGNDAVKKLNTLFFIFK